MQGLSCGRARTKSLMGPDLEDKGVPFFWRRYGIDDYARDRCSGPVEDVVLSGPTKGAGVVLRLATREAVACRLLPAMGQEQAAPDV